MKTSSITFVGGIVIDDVLKIKGTHSAEESKIPAEETGQVIGGSAGNASLAAAAIKEAYMPDADIQIGMISKMGNGPTQSTPAKNYIKNNGINILDAINTQKEFEIARYVAIIDEAGKRIVYTTSNPFPENDPDFLKKLEAKIANTDIVHIHTRLPNLAMASAKTAHRLGKQIIIDASNYDNTLNDILPYATHVILPDELKLPSTPKGQETPPEEIFKYIKNFKDIKHAAVMCGGNDTLYFDHGTEGRIKVPNLTMVDKLGVGDTARAALCLALTQNIDFPQALKFGNAMASFAGTYKNRKWVDALKENPNLLTKITGYDASPLINGEQKTSNEFPNTSPLTSPA